MERSGVTFRHLSDVRAVPGHEALFTEDGRLIEPTVHIRKGGPVRRPPDGIVLDGSAETLHEPVVYLGHLPKKHFGHFIYEGLGRTWALTSPATAGLSVLHHRAAFAPYELELLEPLLGSLGRLRRVDRPLRLREAIVPSQGAIIGEPIAPEMGDVYDRIRDAIVGGPIRRTTQPLYLSRTRLPHHLRRTLGEEALERRLRRAGFAIFHPQEHPLEHQLAAVAAAENVVGLDGSALHLTLFRSLDGARTVKLNAFTEEPNQAAVDAFRGAEGIHVHAQYPLHLRVPRFPRGPTVALGPYRNFLVPPLAERQVHARL